jgi:hypothetical protein
MTPEPVSAWLVRPRDRANAGAVTLRLDGGILSISTPDEELRIEATDIIRVRRLPLSPVLSIVYRDGDARSKMFLYFARPSLNTWTEQRFGTRGSMERAADAARLTRAGRELKPVIAEWIRAIREAGGERP